VAPSIFADVPIENRSKRYSYIPTATVLLKLRGEGFQPFMACQTRVRLEERRDFTKHMLRHASQITARGIANEIILLKFARRHAGPLRGCMRRPMESRWMPGHWRSICWRPSWCGTGKG